MGVNESGLAREVNFLFSVGFFWGKSNPPGEFMHLSNRQLCQVDESHLTTGFSLPMREVVRFSKMEVQSNFVSPFLLGIFFF